MFAARQASRSVFGAAAAQRRAFSATAANVRPAHPNPIERSKATPADKSASQATKVAVLGAGGGIGQPLSLLLKLNPRVSELALFDIKGAPGVAADVGHINTKSIVSVTNT